MHEDPSGHPDRILRSKWHQFFPQQVWKIQTLSSSRAFLIAVLGCRARHRRGPPAHRNNNTEESHSAARPCRSPCARHSCRTSGHRARYPARAPWRPREKSEYGLTRIIGSHQVRFFFGLIIPGRPQIDLGRTPDGPWINPKITAEGPWMDPSWTPDGPWTDAPRTGLGQRFSALCPTREARADFLFPSPATQEKPGRPSVVFIGSRCVQKLIIQDELYKNIEILHANMELDLLIAASKFLGSTRSQKMPSILRGVICGVVSEWCKHLHGHFDPSCQDDGPSYWSQELWVWSGTYLSCVRPRGVKDRSQFGHCEHEKGQIQSIARPVEAMRSRSQFAPVLGILLPQWNPTALASRYSNTRSKGFHSDEDDSTMID